MSQEQTQYADAEVMPQAKRRHRRVPATQSMNAGLTSGWTLRDRWEWDQRKVPAYQCGVAWRIGMRPGFYSGVGLAR